MSNNLQAESKSINDGEIIFSEFETGNSFFLIQSGNVELVKILGDNAKTLDILGPSDMFGEMALLEDSPRTACAIAKGEVRLMEFDKSNFQNLMLTNPQIAYKLLKMFVKRIYDAKRRFMILMLHDVNARIADVFLMLDETEPVENKYESNKREFKINVDGIARWAGLSSTKTKESLAYYSKLGYIEIGPEKMTVKDINNFIRIVNNARSKHKSRPAARRGFGVRRFFLLFYGRRLLQFSEFRILAFKGGKTAVFLGEKRLVMHRELSATFFTAFFGKLYPQFPHAVVSPFLKHVFYLLCIYNIIKFFYFLFRHILLP
jgi:CRP-like cAMP-binding protein